jgi:hypothetical protein
LLLPIAGAVAFFLVSLVTVRILRPREPRRFFLAYALVLLAAAAVACLWLWPLRTTEDALGLACVLLLQLLACLTMWNAFYSLLWGFSGSLMHDLSSDPSVRERGALIRSYAGEGRIDRILARRLPNLQRGGWIDMEGETLTLRPKGRFMALGTLLAFKVFSLGMGGGVK